MKLGRWLSRKLRNLWQESRLISNYRPRWEEAIGWLASLEVAHRCWKMPQKRRWWREPKAIMLCWWRMQWHQRQWWILVDSRLWGGHDRIDSVVRGGPKTWWGWAKVAAAVGCKSKITGRKVKYFILIFIEQSISCHMVRSEPFGYLWA